MKNIQYFFSIYIMGCLEMLIIDDNLFCSGNQEEKQFCQQKPPMQNPQKSWKENGYKQDNKKNKLDKHSYCKIAIIRAKKMQFLLHEDNDNIQSYNDLVMIYKYFSWNKVIMNNNSDLGFISHRLQNLIAGNNPIAIWWCWYSDWNESWSWSCN